MIPIPESPDDLLRQGVAALKMGDRALAINLLARAVRNDPQSELAWLYLAGAVTDPTQRRTCLERVLSLNPLNEAARQGLHGLGRAPAPAPAPAPVAPIPATSTTMRLPPTPASLEIQTPDKATHHLADRLIWALIIILGLMLLLGAGIYVIVMLRG